MLLEWDLLLQAEPLERELTVFGKEMWLWNLTCKIRFLVKKRDYETPKLQIIILVKKCEYFV